MLDEGQGGSRPNHRTQELLLMNTNVRQWRKSCRIRKSMLHKIMSYSMCEFDWWCGCLRLKERWCYKRIAALKHRCDDT
jgi:hypothetical protein